MLTTVPPTTSVSVPQLFAAGIGPGILLVALGSGKPPTPPMKILMTWRDVKAIRKVWPRTLVIKGTMSVQDARVAIEHGADGLVVSNHGGRAMDSSLATLDVLGSIAPEVGGSTTLMMDGGIRRGSNIVKAVALGADLVLLGRAPLYGLAAAGQPGVEKAIDLLRSQLEKTMSYVGCCSVRELGSQIFAERNEH